MSKPATRQPYLLALLVTLALLLALLLSGCGGTATSTGGPASDSQGISIAELKLPAEDWGLPTPFTFYPRGPGYVHLSFVYDTLVWKNEREVIPWLAREWQVSPDQLTWTFKLRPGVKWQDGQPLTARDVVFTFDYLGKNNFEWARFDMIERVDAPDDQTVVFILKKPFVPFMQQIAGNVPIIPQHIWQNIQDPRKEAHPGLCVGSGPFKLVAYDKSQGTYEYAANKDFFLGEPRVKKLLFVPASDKVAALEKGDIHAGDIPASLLAKFEQNQRFKVLSGPAFWVLKLQFNLEKEPFNQPVVRQAIAYAINRPELIEKAVPGGLKGAKPGNPGFLPPESDWFDKQYYDLYPYDINKASGLLQQAGITDRDYDGIAEDKTGRKMQFTLLAPQQYSREAENIKLMLKEVGLILDLKLVNIKAIDNLVKSKQFDLAINGHGGLGGDPSMIMGFGVARGGIRTPGTPESPEYLQVAQKLLVTPDENQRRALASQMQKMYAAELPCLPLYYPVWYFAYNPQAFDGWFYTCKGGIGIGIPMLYNKLAFVGGK